MTLDEQGRSSHPRSHQPQEEPRTAATVSTDALQIEQGAELPPTSKGEETTQQSSSDTTSSIPLPARGSIVLPSLIIPFSILGLLIRLGLVWIETFSGQQVFALAWPQFVGCVLMGLFVSTRSRIEQGLVADGRTITKGHWIGSFVYVGLSSGLCGSITTFSSWSLGMFLEFINPSKLGRHPLQNVSVGVVSTCFSRSK